MLNNDFMYSWKKIKVSDNVEVKIIEKHLKTK